NVTGVQTCALPICTSLIHIFGITLKKSLNDDFFITSWCKPIGSFYSCVEDVVCGCEVWVEPVIVWVVHLCDGGTLVQFAYLENCFSQISYFTFLVCGDLWPDEVVVDNACRIPKV